MFPYVRVLIACAALVACSVELAPMERYQAMTTSSLWVEHALTSSPLELAMIEAQLGVRGETSSGNQFLGERTSGAYGHPLYQRTAAASGDVDCSDFPYAAAAQKFFISAGGPIIDPNNLDRDGDGLACEWGATLVRSVATHKAEQRAAQRRWEASNKCYVGPRGGTYTLTASGEKDYEGC